MEQEMLRAREEYIESIKRELLGPGSEISLPDSEHELISTSPEVRYSIGILFPRDNKLNADNGDSARVETVPDTPEEEDDELPEIEDEEERQEKPEPSDAGEEENLDEEISLAAQNMPSSVGITFYVQGETDIVNCSVSFGTYRKAIASDCRIPFSPCDPDNYKVPMAAAHLAYYDAERKCLRLQTGGVTRKMVRELNERDVLGEDDHGLIDALYKLSSQLRSGYVRIPHYSDVILDFRYGDYIDANREIDGTKAKVTALRRRVGADVYAVTIMLVNDDEGKANGTNCIFQPMIRIDSEKNRFVFKEYAGVSDFSVMDEEEQALEMQYRNKRVFATGLGTSAGWEIDGEGRGSLFNDFFPEVEVPSMDFTLPSWAKVDAAALSMKYLSDLEAGQKEEKLEKLDAVAEAYREWIVRQKETIQTLDPKYHDIADVTIERCERSYRRMKSGLKMLSDNTAAWDAFQLANRAMYMQRVHLKIQQMTSDRDRFPDDEQLSELIEDIDYRTIDQRVKDRYAWRPFQIAFLLMSITSICDESSADRDLVDLIWFPTGGGKTEAYLGLTAFTIFYRRMTFPKQSGGTTVIMRYTLRLLAAQQFTRASTLICACEYIRRESKGKRRKTATYDLGDEPITIGLWIGSAHTPNKNDDAKKELKFLLDAGAGDIRYAKDKHNKFQVLKCPWCGTKLVKEKIGDRLVGVFGYRMRNNRHFEIFCPQESCYFNEVGSLPVQIVDDELYENPPTLLFGTVDKFAMLPWKKEIGRFFAIGTQDRAPELIIQDELHLISGPLGTMVGLYETAIDELCRSKGSKTKIVASTATIRRAKEQCASLYDREVVQFPSPGLDAEDSFFAREATIDYEHGVYGRKYVGLMPSGKTKAMMEVRSIAALMQQIKMMDLPDEIKDKFWTLTVYFNSLKDLGKCSNLVDDDVKDFIKRTAFRLGTAKDARGIVGADELTSRVSTTELNETLDKLEKLTYSKENVEKKRFASNILLATNMISVGIDVARLNVMLLVGQPKLTSEYIQASSRIGRSYPGVAFTLYDGSKSRDRSHYEQFKPYHESFYKHVEPTGATPFSKPARDRALHAVMIALLRMSEPELSEEKGAALFTREKYAERIEKFKAFITARNSGIIARQHSPMEDESALIGEEIDTLLERWEHLAEEYSEDNFFYGERFFVKAPESGKGRLMKTFNTAPFDPAFDTMTSMRNVDATVAGNVLVWEDEL